DCTFSRRAGSMLSTDSRGGGGLNGGMACAGSSSAAAPPAAANPITTAISSRLPRMPHPARCRRPWPSHAPIHRSWGAAALSQTRIALPRRRAISTGNVLAAEPTMTPPPRRAVFLDRDGVLNATYLRDGVTVPPATPEEFVLLPGVVEAA